MVKSANSPDACECSIANFGDSEVERLRAALNLVWFIHVRDHVHLGLERYSGITRDCIPCICACALGQSIDGACETSQLIERLELLRARAKDKDNQP